MIEAIANRSGSWDVMTDNGRNHTGRDAIEWSKLAEQHGAGELIVTSIDSDGMCKGFDIELVKRISETVSIPVIASGGLGATSHLTSLMEETTVSGAAIAHALHWQNVTLEKLRDAEMEAGAYVRPIPKPAAFRGNHSDFTQTL